MHCPGGATWLRWKLPSHAVAGANGGVMTKRALLIGSQTYGLAGVNGDVALMAETLEARGFETEVRIDDDATRAGIIAAYERLIEETPSGSTDPVVIYYSGHGGRTRSSTAGRTSNARPALAPPLSGPLRHGGQQRERFPRPAVRGAEQPAAAADQPRT